MTGLSPAAVDLLGRAPSAAWLAAKGLAHLASARWDQTRWLESSYGPHCVGSAMAAQAGFRPHYYDDPHRAHTGDLWWDVAIATTGDVTLPRSGLSLYAPEAEADEIAEALQTIIRRNPERTIAVDVGDAVPANRSRAKRLGLNELMARNHDRRVAA